MDVSGWNANNSILDFRCLVMPRDELKLSSASEDGENIKSTLLIILYYH